MRKMALVLGEVERELLGQGQAEGRIETEGRAEASERLAAYVGGLAALLLREGETPEAVLVAAGAAAKAGQRPPELVRAVDALRHALIAASGQAPADWDLIDPNTGLRDSASRRVIPGLRVFLEDLRSPFNVGSIFRSADAFGVEELILSPSCADPLHPRALRSAMGAVELLSWRRDSLENLAGLGPLFALELGGTAIGSFQFPRRGTVVLGSEELGITREARAACAYGTVSIPMSGAKASLNVAVAFGILMHEWTSSL
jgi:RNA methyltransferase, TrmH family